MPSNDIPNELFDDFEEQGQSLIGSLHLDTEDEPARRGAASRANSVRFDESALHGSSWAQNGRQSGDFGLVRPGSGLGGHGMMERSLSHKSDGRHSSAGHSVHSVHSHHSLASGRASSLGLDTTFTPGGREDDSPINIPEPPPGFFLLGSVPSIVRCWLTDNFAHDSLLYADICTGSQKSVVEITLIKDLGLTDDVHRDMDGIPRIRLPVYLTEATVSHSHSRTASPAPQMPSINVSFEVIGMEQTDVMEVKKGIRVFIGSDALREHSADVLFSQNRMSLYSSDRDKLSVPFVRPEDNTAYKYIQTMTYIPERPKLNATARPFVFSESKRQVSSTDVSEAVPAKASSTMDNLRDMSSVASESSLKQAAVAGSAGTSNMWESGGESERQYKETSGSESATREPVTPATEAGEEQTHRPLTSSGGIWNSWRHGTNPSSSEGKEATPLSGYQPAGRGGRSMKVLKPSKSGITSSARTGAAYEPPPPSRSNGDRRKSQTGADVGSGVVSGRWEARRAVTGTADNGAGSDTETKPASATRETRSASGTPRTSTNPVGGASAFSWMTPAPGKSRPPTTAAE